MFQALHERLLDKLRAAGRLDSRALSATPPRCGRYGGEETGPSPVDRPKPGSKHHLITDANGIPLACLLTGANAHDVTQLLPLVEAIPPIRGSSEDPAQAPRRCSPTAATTRRHIGRHSAARGSGR